MDDPFGNPKNYIWEQIHRDQERRAEIWHERELAEIRTQSHALVWTGTTEELTQTIIRWYDSGWIVAGSLGEALRKTSIHFVRPDGLPAIQIPLPAPQSEPNDAAAKNPRYAFVLPILEKRGWSVLDWANESGVAHATALDYLAGKTKPYRSTKVKLAKSLGVSIELLPK